MSRAQQRAVAHEEQLLQHLLTTSENIYIAVVDADGRYIYVNPAFDKRFNATAGELLGTYAPTTILAEDRPKLVEAVTRCFAAPGIPIRITLRKPVIHEILWTDWELIGVASSERGTVDRVLCTGFDITRQHAMYDALLASQAEQKEALAALEESNTRFEQLVNHIDVTFWMSDTALGRVIYASPAFAKSWGHTVEELYERQEIFVESIHPDDRQLAVSALIEQEQGRQTEREYRVVQPDGSIRYIWDRGFPIMDTEGRVLRVAGIATDITDIKLAAAHIRQLNETLEQRVEQRTLELRRTSEQLVESNRELEWAARMKDEFLANVSHELRTPLTGILALTEALLANTYGAISDVQQRPLNMIEESGRHLLSLINDVLDVAKVQAGKLEIELEAVPADDVCMASLRLVREVATRKRQQVSFAIEPIGLVIRADSRRLKQILVNLLSNAVKFTPEGGQAGLIVRGDPQQKTVTFTVWDKGIGIPEERQQTIFEPFTQVQSDFSRSYAGTGLGLALASRLAILHGGSISFESKVDQGSKFHVVLPWAPSTGKEAAPPAASSAEDHQTGESSLHSLPATSSLRPPQETAQPATASILLAEDNPVTSRVVTDFLVAQGFTVMQAKDGSEALHLAETCHPDLILMDIQMPGMDGVTAIRRIRALPDKALARVPIIVLTAHAMQGAREQFLQTGADGYLSKPLRLAELRKCIGEYVLHR